MDGGESEEKTSMYLRQPSCFMQVAWGQRNYVHVPGCVSAQLRKKQYRLLAGETRQ